MATINIAKDFTTTPGARYISDGEFSGQVFREKYLEPLFIDPQDKSKIQIFLDGTEGYATSFLEEAFGGLARLVGSDRCLSRLELLSNDDALLVEEIIGYIKDVDEQGPKVSVG